MVLQNKYKARASRRYNAARGGASDGRGRGRGRGGTRRGGGVAHSFTSDSFPSLPGQGSDEEEEARDDDDETGEGDGEAESDDSEMRRQRAKYGPRKMTSNAWRFEEPSQGEGDKRDGTGGASGEKEDEEEEEEVDLRGLMERVMKLDSSRHSKALSSEQSAKDALDAETADIDASLLHLLDRQRERERRQNEEQSASEGFARGGKHDHLRYALSDEQRREMEREGKRLLEDKARQEKHARRARVLQQSARTISLNIGDQRRSTSSANDGSRSKMKKAKESSLYSASKLYDDQDRRKDEPTSDDVDGFLEELDRPNPLIALPHSSDARSVKASQIAANSSDPRHSHVGAEEDFLDGLL